MKRLLLLTTLLVMISTSIPAQNFVLYDPPSKFPEWAKVALVYSTSIALDAMGDAMNDNGNKEWAHALNAASVGTLLMSPFIINYKQDRWGRYLTSYVTMRLAIFDPIYNTTRGLPLSYMGTTSLYDKALNKAPAHFMYYVRSVSFAVSLSININELNGYKSRKRY